jgi:dipeptidyl aminopeptidase/acylaminoacyl peptidase
VCFGSAADGQPYAFTAELCQLLTDAEAAVVVTFDFYGWGLTGGNPDDWSYGRWAASLSHVIANIGAEPWADNRRVAAVGISAGSTALLRHAIERDSMAAGICVATFPGHFLSTSEGAASGPAKMLADHLDALMAGQQIEIEGLGLVGSAFLMDAVAGAPIYRLQEVSCPILFLQGGADNIFRRTDARLGYDLLRSFGMPAGYQEISGGYHTLSNVARQGADAVLAWLREILFWN